MKTFIGPLTFLTLEPLLLFPIFECYLWLLGFLNWLSKVRWICFFLMSESVLFIPENNAVFKLINQLHTDAVIKRCTPKNLRNSWQQQNPCEKYLWLNSDLIKLQFFSMLLYFHGENKINKFSFPVFFKLFGTSLITAILQNSFQKHI